MGKIVIPKNSASIEEVMGAIQIYYDHNDWLSNTDYIAIYKQRIGVIGDDRDSSAYTKKTEIGCYYGFLEWEDIDKVKSPRRITPRGRVFLEHYNANNMEAVHEDIMKSLEEVSFGRNNYACRSCDSDIEPPALFLRAMIDLGHLTNKEFAYLVYMMEYEGQHYTETIEEIKLIRSNDKKIELPEEANKFADPKPILILERWGVLSSEQIGGSKCTSISAVFWKKYSDRLKNLKIYNIDKNVNDSGKREETQECTDVEITPEWFAAKAVEFPNLDSDAEKFLLKFRMIFAPEKLQELSGIELLNSIFLNNDNKTSLCYILEFDSECRMIFGSIKSGTSYKYGLHYSKKNNSWATGSSAKPIFLSEDEAIELGTQIRDSLVAGAEIIADAGEIKSIDDYKSLYTDLDDITDGYINKVWFLKYYAMMFPEVFPPIYSTNAQNTVLNKLKLASGDNPITRSGLIREYVDKCGISNIVFSRIFWTYCNGDGNQSEEKQEEKIKLKTCLEVTRLPRKNKIHPINFIVYGAPGTGKTYSMVEYALAIIDGISIDTFRDNNKDRKANVARYKELVKAGQVVFTTFHQNYGYEEFIQGLRPDKDSETMAFKTVDGVFKVIADTALNDTEDKNYVIIIDEINRANISKVFGELITLVEEDKRWGELNETSVTLQSGDPFAVPNNLYIVGTMNSADKSISLIDAALRRRFDFIEQKPDTNLVTDPMLKAVLTNINLKLVKDLDSTDLLVGHSYFMDKSEKELPSILNNNIIPLLYEYYYDDRKKVRDLIANLIKDTGAQIEIVDEEVGRLRVKGV